MLRLAKIRQRRRDIHWLVWMIPRRKLTSGRLVPRRPSRLILEVLSTRPILGRERHWLHIPTPRPSGNDLKCTAHVCLLSAPSTFTLTEQLLDTLSGVPPLYTILNDCAGSLTLDVQHTSQHTWKTSSCRLEGHSHCNYDLRFPGTYSLKKYHKEDIFGRDVLLVG